MPTTRRLHEFAAKTNFNPWGLAADFDLPGDFFNFVSMRANRHTDKNFTAQLSEVTAASSLFDAEIENRGGRGSRQHDAEHLLFRMIATKTAGEQPTGGEGFAIS